MSAYISWRYFKLKSGQVVTTTFPKWIDMRDSDRYSGCTSQTTIEVHHVFHNCHIGCSQRSKKRSANKKENWSIPVTVKQLFRSRKATAAVLEFIETTKAVITGSRARKTQ